ncbi:major capsid family protein [Commensalibacter nepenthis]|uniref:DUF2184 domain-containing protein n=1 Tax=Commensalibacter nepenthis TaxID=3043872 RepID=A0ABT6Q831_9PROT|nr:major capsid family protein [Commensalibacter sp. TBRC 10068]MDI2113064.1 DUF2184 domain-containing protein [Commensalibacter sp. TBRC 10068]
MSTLAPASFRLNPSFSSPNVLVDRNQPSGAFYLLQNGEFRVQLGLADKMVYMNRLGIKTRNSIAQDSQNELASVDIAMGQVQTPTYLLQARAIYNRHEVAAASAYNVALPMAFSLALRQAHYNQLRDLLLYGFQPEYGEGILNAVGAKRTVIPADSNGTKDVLNMISGEISEFLLKEITDIINRTQQAGLKNIITILAPQRVLNQFAISKIVSLSTYQMAGGGVATIKGQLDAILKDNDTVLLWQYDDTLQGKGDNGSDVIIISLVELDMGGFDRAINTNIFAQNISPQENACNLMFTDVPAPVEFITPLAGTATHIQAEMRATPGWAVRPTATTIISAAIEVDDVNENDRSFNFASNTATDGKGETQTTDGTVAGNNTNTGSTKSTSNTATDGKNK